jgi:hypothetical protein
VRGRARRGLGPAVVIQRALAEQRGEEPARLPGPEAADFVLATAVALRSVAGEHAAG